VLLVTGDEATCREGTELLGARLTTVAVKKGHGSHGARQLPAVRARERIEDGARRALSDLKAVPPYDPGHPCEIRVEFKVTDVPSRLARYADVELADPRTIVSRADDWWTAWSQFFFLG
jgi:D-amino peptidase